MNLFILPKRYTNTKHHNRKSISVFITFSSSSAVATFFIHFSLSAAIFARRERCSLQSRLKLSDFFIFDLFYFQRINQSSQRWKNLPTYAILQFLLATHFYIWYVKLVFLRTINKECFWKRYSIRESDKWRFDVAHWFFIHQQKSIWIAIKTVISHGK